MAAVEAKPVLPDVCLMDGIRYCSEHLGMDSFEPLVQLLRHQQACKESGDIAEAHSVKRGVFNYGASESTLRPFPLPIIGSLDTEYTVSVRSRPFQLRLSAVLLRHDHTRGYDSVPYEMVSSVLVHRESYGLSIRFQLGEHHRCPRLRSTLVMVATGAESVGSSKGFSAPNAASAEPRYLSRDGC